MACTRTHGVLPLFIPATRFSGLKFPDMSRPETLERKYTGKLPPDAQAFMCDLLALNPSDRLTCAECLQVCCLSAAVLVYKHSVLAAGAPAH
jgi:hypothetical protein